MIDDEVTYTTKLFSFGSEHTLPDGTPAGDKTVSVEAPVDVDHRALFMAWLGSNKFSSEYTEREYSKSVMSRRNTVAWHISVEQVCDQCEWPDSQCKCLLPDPWTDPDL